MYTIKLLYEEWDGFPEIANWHYFTGFCETMSCHAIISISGAMTLGICLKSYNEFAAGINVACS